MTAFTEGPSHFTYAKGSSIIPTHFAPTSDKIRVFGFKASVGAICIDFTWHPVEPGWLYVVPPHHRIYMPGSLWEDCVCYGLDQDALPEEVQLRLFRLHFALRKHVPATSDLQTVETIMGAISSFPTVNGEEFHLVCKASSILDYHEVALRFLRFLELQRPSQKLTVNANWTTELYHHERKVRRACLETFGVSPVAIVRYRVVQEAVRLLAETSCKVEDVAEHLEFSDASKCTRFLKERLGMCPVQFRRIVRHLHERQG